MTKTRMAAIAKVCKDYDAALTATIAANPAAGDILHGSKDDAALVDEICARLRTAGAPKKYVIAVPSGDVQVVVDPTLSAGSIRATDEDGKKTAFQLAAGSGNDIGGRG